MSQRVTLRTADKRHSLTAYLGATQPSVTDGRGGWEEKARPRRPAVVEWAGPAARKATIEILLDAWKTGGSIAAQMAVVDALAPPAPRVEGPVLYVIGSPLVPSTVPWVAQSVDFADALERRGGGLARVTVTFTLIEKRTADVVTRSSPAKRSTGRNGTPSRGQPRKHVVKAGETLTSIAAKELGHASRWTEIAKLNSIRDPKKIRVGQSLTLPAK